MPWNFMQLQLHRDAGRIDPMIGEGGLSREAALAAVQDLLDRGSTLQPQLFAGVAETWRRGAKDDTVYAGDFLWTIYQYPQGEDPTFAAMAWVEDFSQRGTGQSAAWSADPPGGGPDPQDVISRRVIGTLTGRQYPEVLPDELAPWYCYTADGGHSIVIALPRADRRPREGDVLPAPVKAVLRAGWTLTDGYVVCDLPYDPELGLDTDPSDNELDAGQPTPAPEPHVLAVGKPYNPAVSQWPDGAAELRLQPHGAEFALFLDAPAAHETTAFTKGNAEFALTATGRYLVWSYRFVNPKKSRNPAAQGPGIPWSDALWEYHRQAARHPVGLPGERGTSFALHLVLIDAATGIVKGLRLVSPPVAFADALRDAVDRQAQVPHDPAAAERDIKALYDRYSSTDILLHADARFEALRDGTTR